jgi:two-component system NtrC family sensor kinase
VPLVNNGTTIGLITVTRKETGSFADHHVQLLQSFADQAVIAIENVRLFDETQEALERQTASAEILRVIASSPSDLQPVFEAIAARSVQLVGGHSAAVSMFVGDRVELGAITPVNPEADAGLKALYPRRLADYPLFELARGGEVTQVFDIEAESRVPPVAKAMARAHGFRSLLVVPMNSDKGPVGAITVTRKEPGTFAEHHIQMRVAAAGLPSREVAVGQRRRVGGVSKVSGNLIAGVKTAWSISATFIRLALELRRQKRDQRLPA